MSLSEVAKLLSGIGLFLYGLTIMDVSLERMAGSKLQLLLNRLTVTPVLSAVLGFALAVLTQSGAAVVILIMGLVNAALLPPQAAVCIVMGANVGSTITGQLLRLQELSGGVLSTVLSPTFFGHVAVFVGVVWYLIVRKGVVKLQANLSYFLIGFGLLFVGMGGISAALDTLSESELLRRAFNVLQNPFWGMLAGMVAALLLQSSSAGVGILQTLSLRGYVTYGSAIPILLGINVGITLLPFAASWGASKNARRCALANLYFNLIGAVMCASVLYTTKSVIAFDWWDAHIDMGMVANIHTLFNLTVMLVMLPLAHLLVKLTVLTIPDSPEQLSDWDVMGLDQRLLDTPDIAIQQALKVLQTVADTVGKTYAAAMPVVFHYDAEVVNRIHQNKVSVEKTTDTLNAYLIQLTQRPLNQEQAALANGIKSCSSEYDRIVQYAARLATYSGEMLDRGIRFSEQGVRELYLLDDAVIEILELTKAACVAEEHEVAERVEPLAETIRRMAKTMRERYTQRLRAGGCTADAGTFYLDILRTLEHLSEHCSDVAAGILYGGLGSREAAKRANVLHNTGDGVARFNENLTEYKRKYYSLLELQEMPLPQL